MYVFDDTPGTIPNNSIILTNNFGQIPRFQCISGSLLPNIGQWIAPSGQDITLSASDPFDVVTGGQDDPGYLDISLHSGQILSIHDQGVYSCRIPDETGTTTSVFVGIYIPALASMMVLTFFVCNSHCVANNVSLTIAPVSIVSFQENSVAVFSVNCSSSGSPPTNVTWMKNGEIVTFLDNFTTNQYLRDGVMAVYDNILTSSLLQPSQVIGTYTCSIDNLVSPPTEATLTIQG